MLVALVLLAVAASDAFAQKRSPAVTRDTDRDGVPDVKDRCPGTPPGAAVDAAGCPAGAAPAPRPAPASAAGESAAAPAAATVSATGATRVGLGFGLNLGYGVVSIPILLRGGVALEPEVGL